MYSKYELLMDVLAAASTPVEVIVRTYIRLNSQKLLSN